MTAAPISPLVADLVSATLAITQNTTTRLIDSLMDQVAEARAREAAVEAGILALLSGPYMPTPAAIQRALYPSAELVAEFRADGAS